MNIVASRVDERLVHGQIMTSWSKYLQLKRIIVVDDQLAVDSFMTTILTMAAPAGLEIEILSVADAAAKVQQDTSPVATMLLFKCIGQARALIEALKDTVTPLMELNIGNVGSVPGRTQITKNVFLSPEETADITALENLGINVFLQMLYTDSVVSAQDIL